MALAIPARLFFRNNAITNRYRVGAVFLDLIMDENHDRSNIITSNRIETGSNFNDHIYNNPETASMTGLISNFSIKAPGFLVNRAQDAFNLLEKIWKLRQPVTIATVLKVYKNVGINNISINRNNATGEALSFSISFQQLNIVQLKQAALEVSVSPNIDTAAGKQASSVVNAGKQAGL